MSNIKLFASQKIRSQWDEKEKNGISALLMLLKF